LVKLAAFLKLFLLALIAIAAVCAQTSLAQQQAPKPAQIDRNGVLILIRNTLIALDQANKTGNYTVLRDLSAPQFQANNAARLAEIFADLRRNNIDLSGIAAVDPQLSMLPQIEQGGVMHLAGLFPSVPSQINFELYFSPVAGAWKLLGISVKLGSSAPVAPMEPAAEAAAPAANSRPPSLRMGVKKAN